MISFDAAGTLIDVNWKPGETALEAARLAGAELPERSEGSFDLLVRSQWIEYTALNLTRDVDRLDDFWKQLGRTWFEGMNLPYASKFESHFWDLLYGPNQQVFTLFEDVRPALSLLLDKGYRLAVLSNWDYSLHRVIKQMGIYDEFEIVVASLEEGPEKPDPRIFEILTKRMNVHASEVVHVGDNAIDDYQGARKAGMRGILVDRTQPNPNPPFVTSLLDLPQVL